MSFDQNRLYDLLPTLYRLRDAALGRALTVADQDGPLRALLGVIAEQVGILEEDLAQLYDDQFIETCAEWVVPYIGDLVGVRGLTVFPNARFSQRSQVANTLAYRRRKGTAAVIEQLARDVTGWDANVVEYFQHLATTQYMNHLRPGNRAMASLRNGDALELVNTPFDPLTRTADVRRIEPRRGRYNIPNIGVFLWRISSYPVTGAPAYRVDDHRFTFDVLGRSLPLYVNPLPETIITHVAEPANVPMSLSRRVLTRDLAAHYGPTGSLWITTGDGPPVPVALAEIEVCDLSNVKDLAGQDVLNGAGEPVGWVNMLQHQITIDPGVKLAIDPVLGRLAFLKPQPVTASVRVNYHYGFSANLGGGEYDRADTFFTDTPPPRLLQLGKPTSATDLQTAFDALAATGGIIELTTNELYAETPVIRIRVGKTIELRGADQKRPVLALSGDLLVFGEANAEGTGAGLILNGLLISGGQIRVPGQNEAGTHDNQVATLSIRHCTLLPGPSPAVVTAVANIPAQPARPRLHVALPTCTVDISDAITGSLRVTGDASLSLHNTIVDAGQPTNIAIAGLLADNPPTIFEADQPGASLTVTNSTIIGKVYTRLMTLASNTIFLADVAPADQWKPTPVLAERQQEGCVRFSYLPPGSRLPAPHECQPRTATDAARVRPVFASLRPGDPGYGQPSLRCATEITEGADDGAGMGALHDLFQPQRVANLRTRLDEYLRFGLEAGIFFGS